MTDKNQDALSASDIMLDLCYRVLAGAELDLRAAPVTEMNQETIRRVQSCSERLPKVRKLVKDALQALTSIPDMREAWQGIESAPRDGRRIYAWCENWTGPMTVQYYGITGWGFSNERLLHQPTHWIPLENLPVPPKGEKT